MEKLIKARIYNCSNQSVIKQSSSIKEDILSCQDTKTLSESTGVTSEFPKGKASGWPVWGNCAKKKKNKTNNQTSQIHKIP